MKMFGQVDLTSTGALEVFLLVQLNVYIPALALCSCIQMLSVGLGVLLLGAPTTNIVVQI